MTSAQHYYFNASEQEMQELLHALIQRYIVESDIRAAHGEETVDPPAMIERLQRLLEQSESDMHRAFHTSEEMLWEYAWHTFSNEWAWYRARQDVKKTLGTKARHCSPEFLQQLISRCCEDQFEHYLEEIAMRERKRRTSAKRKQSSSPSNRSSKNLP